MLKIQTQRSSSATRRIVDALTERIVRGVYPPGSRLPAERELSAEFILDRSLIRSALSELSEAGLIVREPGCRPRVRSNSDSSTTDRTPTDREQPTLQAIAVILPQHEADQGSRKIMRGINLALRSLKAPYRPIIFDTDLRNASPQVLEQEACTAIESEGIAGAIVWPTLEAGSLASWRGVQERGHPVVFVDRYDVDLPCDFVGVDNHAAAREATEYLLALGHTRIVHLTQDIAATSVQERIAGYSEALRMAAPRGIPEIQWILSAETYPKCMQDFVTWFLETEQPPTAVFAVNDQVAHTLIALLKAQGKQVPEDLSVLGFDDDELYSASPALLSTVRQPFERIGHRAVELLLQRLKMPPYATSATTFQHILLPTHLVERSTCQALRTFNS
jgi:GntR family transcriptional regulator of arabinose operon